MSMIVHVIQKIMRLMMATVMLTTTMSMMMTIVMMMQMMVAMMIAIDVRGDPSVWFFYSIDGSGSVISVIVISRPHSVHASLGRTLSICRMCIRVCCGRPAME